MYWFLLLFKLVMVLSGATWCILGFSGALWCSLKLPDCLWGSLGLSGAVCCSMVKTDCEIQMWSFLFSNGVLAQAPFFCRLRPRTMCDNNQKVIVEVGRAKDPTHTVFRLQGFADNPQRLVDPLRWL